MVLSSVIAGPAIIKTQSGSAYELQDTVPPRVRRISHHPDHYWKMGVDSMFIALTISPKVGYRMYLADGTVTTPVTSID